MFKIKIFSVSKTKEPWLQHAIEDYSRRLSPILSIEWILTKTSAQLEKLLEKERYLALDPEGKQMTSEAFSSFLTKTLEKEGARLSFVIGGAEGLSDSIRKKAFGLIGLSKWTFTHQLTRLLLIEQIYRAFEIAKGSGYHK